MKRNEKALFKWQMMRPMHMTNTMSTWMISSSSAASRDQYQGYLIFSRKTCKQLVLNLFKDDPNFDFHIMDLRERETTHPMPNYSAFDIAYYRNHADENKNHRSITIGFSVNKTEPDITGNLKKDAYVLTLSYPNGLPDGVTWEELYNCLNMAKPVTIPTGPNDLAEHGHDATCDYSSCVGEDVMVGF